MGRKTSIAAIAALMAAAIVPGTSDAVAFAQVGEAQTTPAAPAEALEPAPQAPQTPEFISQPVVQPAPEDASKIMALFDAPSADAGGAADTARARSLAELVGMMETSAPLSAEMRCLAGAVYFEARGEPLAGQLAVAQVIINRSRDGRFAPTYCGVVAQPAQFSFMRGSRMPAANTASEAWRRAVAIAHIAHRGLWQSEAGNAVFFHASYVQPSWSRAKTRLARIDTHIFYR